LQGFPEAGLGHYFFLSRWQQRIKGKHVVRRPKGSGSIYTCKNGTVLGQHEIDIPSGKKRRYIRGKSKKDVASRLAKAIADRDSGLVFDSQNLTVSKYLYLGGCPPLRDHQGRVLEAMLLDGGKSPHKSYPM
jgi:hypothetical protein